MSALVRGLIEQKRIETTVAKAKEARSLAEKMVTLGRKGGLPSRREAISALGRVRTVKILFDEIVPACQGRNGGYTRIVRLGQRRGDGSEMAILEWIGISAPAKRPKKKEKPEKEQAAK
jgi:large subunit ribosomal protein L17